MPTNRPGILLGMIASLAALAAAVEHALRERFGVRIRAEIARPGELDAWTGVTVSPKLVRFRDERR